jgi:hypothetical protein
MPSQESCRDALLRVIGLTVPADCDGGLPLLGEV